MVFFFFFGFAYKPSWTSALHFSVLRSTDWKSPKTACTIIAIIRDGRGGGGGGGGGEGVKTRKEEFELGIFQLLHTGFLNLCRKCFSVVLISQKNVCCATLITPLNVSSVRDDFVEQNVSISSVLAPYPILNSHKRFAVGALSRTNFKKMSLLDDFSETSEIQL